LLVTKYQAAQQHATEKINLKLRARGPLTRWIDLGAHTLFMIVVDKPLIGAHDKSEKVFAVDPGRRLVIEWTAHLPTTRRNTSTR
jgi:hypothetical protein